MQQTRERQLRQHKPSDKSFQKAYNGGGRYTCRLRRSGGKTERERISMMLPKQLGKTALTKEELKKDRASMRKIGPCGVGQEALYLNSFYFSRRFYVCFCDVDRVFKRVALSRGGYTGKGIFASMPYLVVKMKDGHEKACNFKIEDEVDRILDLVKKEHPNIPVHSAEAARKLERIKREEEALYIEKLSTEAEEAVRCLSEAKAKLEKNSIYSRQLSYAAKQKRIQDHISPSSRLIGMGLFLVAVFLILYGAFALLNEGSFGLAALLSGLALLVLVLASRVLPIQGQNRKSADADWEQALREIGQYIGTDFPVPAQYAHPLVLDWMIRIIRQGRASDVRGALSELKKELKSLNSSVKVSQEIHDAVVDIKPMFLIFDYQD